MKIIDRTRNGVTFLSADGFEAVGGVAHGFSTRLGGVSTGIYESMDLGTTRGDEPGHVRENYRRFFAAIGADADSIAMSNQIHSDLVRPVTCADVKRDLYDVEPYEVDGLVTDIPGVSLVVFGADCLPVLFYDPVRRVAAAAMLAGGGPPRASWSGLWRKWHSTAPVRRIFWLPSDRESPDAVSRPTRTCQRHDVGAGRVRHTLYRSH